MKKRKEKTIVKDVKEFTVIRKDWYRGKGPDKSCLANTANKLCCLGFYAEACGLDRSTIRDLQSPAEAVGATQGREVTTKNSKEVTRESEVIWKTKLVDTSSDVDHIGNTSNCNQLMTLNDDGDIPEKAREAALTKLFKKIGIKVNFK